MADINFEDISRTISDAAEVVGKKTEAFIKVQKIKGQIHSARRSVEKNYKDLGEIIFRRYAVGEPVDEEVAIICEEVSQINANLAEMREELAKTRGCRICPTCEAEVPWEAEYCMKCGSPIPEAQEEAAAAADAETPEDESSKDESEEGQVQQADDMEHTAAEAEVEISVDLNSDTQDSAAEETVEEKTSEDNVL